MRKVAIAVYVESDDDHEAVNKLKGAMESLDDAFYYETGAVVNWDYRIHEVPPERATEVREQRRLKLRADQGEAEDED